MIYVIIYTQCYIENPYCQQPTFCWLKSYITLHNEKHLLSHRLIVLFHIEANTINPILCYASSFVLVMIAISDMVYIVEDNFSDYNSECVHVCMVIRQLRFYIS